MTDTGTETEPHAWPACPWPGWAQLYARLIRDVRELDPELIVDEFEPCGFHPNDMTSSLSPTAADRVFDRIDEAEELAGRTCVVCGQEGDGWPPLCQEHA
ncbi:hypothetical protein [Mycobacteroides abscessus]|uniref:hypothetical protein n=1 Tax=Mycobacteroides abscessus TaxID=36809 RepID=UPI00266F468A|nr:hypothetical protein [Mycobacteroides abscessus]MDO3110428.1 hypothetical protein [Mycobacteroides abscessus subsp. abscessus]